MAVVVQSYPHRTGEHCASTALRNLLAHRGTRLSEAMVFGLASGLGFYYVRHDDYSPSRVFHGRSESLEVDFGANTGISFEERPEADDARAWELLRENLDGGNPVLVSTDTYYLGYQNTTSHFPGHRCVVVGYDDASQTVLIADRKHEAYQRCSFEELRHARNAPDFPVRCENRWGVFGAGAELGRPLAEAIALALRRNARSMLEPCSDFPAGLPAMRALAEDLPRWRDAPDWSWAARFGYQVIVKRGAAGSFFRSLYADFLRESASVLPGLAGLVERVDAMAAGWRRVAEPLEAQSERTRTRPDPQLFVEAGRRVAEVADLEEALFREVLAGV